MRMFGGGGRGVTEGPGCEGGGDEERRRTRRKKRRRHRWRRRRAKDRVWMEKEEEGRFAGERGEGRPQEEREREKR